MNNTLKIIAVIMTLLICMCAVGCALNGDGAEVPNNTIEDHKEYFLNGTAYVSCEGYYTAIYDDMQQYLGDIELNRGLVAKAYGCESDFNKTYIRTVVEDGYGLLSEYGLLRRADVPEFSIDSIDMEEISAIYVTGYRYDRDTDVYAKMVEAINTLSSEQTNMLKSPYFCALEFEGHMGIIYSGVFLTNEEDGLYVSINGRLSTITVDIDPREMPRRSYMEQPTLSVADNRFSLPVGDYTILYDSLGKVEYPKERMSLKDDGKYTCAVAVEGISCPGEIVFLMDEHGNMIYDYVLIEVIVDGYGSSYLATIMDMLTEEDEVYFLEADRKYMIAVRDGYDFDTTSSE